MPMALASRDGAEIWLDQANDAFRRTFALTRAAGRQRLRRVFPDTIADVQRRIDRCLDHGESARLRLAQPAGGEALQFEISIRPVTAAGVCCALISAWPQRSPAGSAAVERALAEAELDERRRIGRELHDSTAQLLLAARLGLSAISSQGAVVGEPRRILEETRQAIEGAQREIRNIAFVLHPPSMMEAGLEGSVRNFALGFARRTGLEIAVEAPRSAFRLPFASKVALFRLAQEALMNVHRHASARSVIVRFRREAGRAVLEIQDDGRGLPAGFGPEMEGVGLSGMRARMSQIGGAFEIASASTGVLVRASVRTGSAPRRPVWRRAAVAAISAGAASAIAARDNPAPA
jgi:signal transduction histidine kinase